MINVAVFVLGCDFGFAEMSKNFIPTQHGLKPLPFCLDFCLLSSDGSIKTQGSLCLTHIVQSYCS